MAALWQGQTYGLGEGQLHMEGLRQSMTNAMTNYFIAVSWLHFFRQLDLCLFHALFLYFDWVKNPGCCSLDFGLSLRSYPVEVG